MILIATGSQLNKVAVQFWNVLRVSEITMLTVLPERRMRECSGLSLSVVTRAFCALSKVNISR